MSFLRLLEQCDARAGLAHSWRDFPPTGLLLYRDGTAEAIGGLPVGASVRQVAVALGRAARANVKNLHGIAVICSAWASKDNPAAPALADDRKRARVLYAADTEHRTHLYSNVEGQTHHQWWDAADCASDGVPHFLSQVLQEATGTAWFFCGTGRHERPTLL